MLRHCFSFLLLLPFSLSALTIWWEGESPISSNFPKNAWPQPTAKEKRLLSEGDWLRFNGKLSPATPIQATYEVTVDEASTYQLWVRKLWKHGPFQWRFNEEDWQEVTRDIALLDSTPLRSHIPANWVYLGEVELSQGRHLFHIELTPEEGVKKTLAAFDCFLLSNDGFVPNAKYKPGEELPGGELAGWFPLSRDLDPFSPEALLDLRYLNEKRAGESGPITRNDKGEFLLGNGDPVRFWGVNLQYRLASQPPVVQRYLTRRLAKLGVNLVRVEGNHFTRGEVGSLSPRYPQSVIEFAESAQEAGIYTSLQLYFPQWLKGARDFHYSEFEGKDAAPFGLLFWHQETQKRYRNWLRELLTTPHPKSGRTLAELPSFAILELQNEDSLFFWTNSPKNLPPPIWAELEKLFAQWASRRYGSAQAALLHWGQSSHPSDDLKVPRLGLTDVWWMTNKALVKAGAGKRKRQEDQIRFFLALQQTFARETIQYVREELGYSGLIVVNNWKSGDQDLLTPLEYHSYAEGDIIDQHRYFGVKLQGAQSAWNIGEGYSYIDRPLLKEPEAAPFLIPGYQGMPTYISEIGWPNPNRYRAESMMLFAAYGSLQGIDAVAHFTITSPRLSAQRWKRFSGDHATTLFSFPASALAYRRGDIARGEVVHRPWFDPDAPLKKHPEIGSKLLGLIGRTEWRPATTGPQSVPPPPKENPIISSTGELSWDKEQGLVTVDTMRYIAAAGFFEEIGEIEVGPLTFDSTNHYGCIQLISLDGRALSNSSKVLIQMVTEEQPYGFEKLGEEIVDLGGPHMIVRENEAKLVLRFGARESYRLQALDQLGESLGEVEELSPSENGTLHFSLRPDALYHLLIR